MPLSKDVDMPQLSFPAGQLEIYTMPACGKGEQNVDMVDTAMQVTHNPTWIAKRCATGLSKLMNKNRETV